MRITVTFKGENLKQKFLAELKVRSEKDLSNIAHVTRDRMRQYLRESIQRPGSTGNLESNITAEKTIEGWGVGNIDRLNKNAPYWHWINYGVAQSGRKIPPMTTGMFVPGIPYPNDNSFREGRLEKGPYIINPKKPIEPHNYIEKTIADIRLIIQQVNKGF